MYERLLALHIDGRLSDAGLLLALQKGWITEAQWVYILAQPVVPPVPAP